MFGWLLVLRLKDTTKGFKQNSIADSCGFESVVTCHVGLNILNHIIYVYMCHIISYICTCFLMQIPYKKYHGKSQCLIFVSSHAVNPMQMPRAALTFCTAPQHSLGRRQRHGLLVLGDREILRTRIDSSKPMGDNGMSQCNKDMIKMLDESRFSR